MIYTITFRNKKEISVDLTEEDYKNLEETLSGESKLLSFGGGLYNTADIVSIERAKEIIPTSRRIEAPKVTGEFNPLSVSTRMKEIWESLKAKGRFNHFESYEKWQEAKTKKCNE